MNYPLNCYYIASSHNTYLLGRQVAGESSIEGYKRALQRGCRCVEIDVWGDNDEPIVNHGLTFTKGSIKFERVIEYLKENAFVATPYPLVLSLEINASSVAQKAVVRILKQVLGRDMVTEQLIEGAILPSPEKLKYKFIIKVKKTSPFQGLVETEDGSYTSTTTTSCDDSGSNSLSIRRSTLNIIDSLSELGVYMQGIKFRNFSLPESKLYNHCFSLSEKTINKMIKDEVKRTSLNKHNRKYFLRVYPSKFRLKSSNFNPIKYWELGVQMVATNWQTYDLGQQINEAMFANEGYVLKPEHLRKPIIRSSKYYSLEPPKPKNIQFRIEIISGHELPVMNPSVSFEIFGSDSVKASGKTSIVMDPVWNEIFNGEFTGYEDFSFLRFAVYSNLEKQDIYGLVVVKLDSIKSEYEKLYLNDQFGQKTNSFLFVKMGYEVCND
ncbi:PLC1 [Candida oxycetoniae]|uniref:Phosphoinositide phospholipase C n=1 Tax=Candida oxycetoniae TaxID=497107 RepID=A0AAI9T1J7_9ASCO|nr:PLC1 [Candida oxycetoniae]KAI3406571.2 PLC1 [Candida oxycetoniae]